MAKYFSSWLPAEQREMMSKTGSYSYQVFVTNRRDRVML